MEVPSAARVTVQQAVQAPTRATRSAGGGCARDNDPGSTCDHSAAHTGTNACYTELLDLVPARAAANATEAPSTDAAAPSPVPPERLSSAGFALTKEALRESLHESGSLASTVVTAASAVGACTAVNTEWGGFHSAAVPRCGADDAMDAESFRPGEQLLEKAVSGYYLGEVVRRCVV